MSTNAQIIVSMRNQADPEVRKLATSFRDLIQRLRDTGATQEQAERKALSHAQALAQLAVKSGQAAQGQRTLAAALSQVDRASTAAVRAETQLVGIQNRLATAQNRGASFANQFGSALKGNLLSVLGPAALATTAIAGVTTAINAGIGAGQAALALRETKNSLRAVAGDAQVYSQVLATARQQQVLFGGSLQENIEGLSGLTITARESGAQLQTLIDLSQRLAVKDPTQGIQGARIALSEALSGDPTSLARRYEIPRQALARLRDETLPVAERLAVIDQYLNRVGLTSEAVAGKVDQDAMAYRRLGAEFEALTIAAGDGLATAFSGAATGLSRLLGVVNGNPQAIAELKALFSGKGSITQQDVDQEARGLAAQRATDVLGGRRAQPAVTRRLGGDDQYQALVAQLAALELKGEETAKTAEQLTKQWLSGALGADQYRQQLAGLGQVTTQAIGAFDEERKAIGDAQIAAQEHTKALVDQTTKTLEAARQTQELATFQQTIAQLGSAVASGLLTSGEAAEQLAGKYDLASGEAERLIRLQAEVAQVDAAKQIAAGQAQVTNRLEAQANAYKKIRDADERRITQTGTAAQKQALLLKQLERARATYGEKSVEFIDAETRLIEFRQQQQVASERAADRAGKARVKDARDVLNLEERTADAQERQMRAALDARLAALDDRKQRRIEDRELAAARRILGSGSTSAEQKAAAQDVLERIPLEQQRRALDIASKSRDAGGTIVGGKLFGSVPGGGQPGQASPGALQQLPTVPGASPAGGQPGIEVLVMLDGQQIAANVTTRLRGGFNGARAGGAGGG